MTDPTLWRKYSANIYIEEASVAAGHLEKGKSIFSYVFYGDFVSSFLPQFSHSFISIHQNRYLFLFLSHPFISIDL
jgi:hypothetical protein